MAEIPGSVRVTGLIAPTDNTDLYAVSDPIYGIDGLRNLTSYTEMYNISSQRKRGGMIAGVPSGATTFYYVLKSSPWNGDHTDWIRLNIQHYSASTTNSTWQDVMNNGSIFTGGTGVIHNAEIIFSGTSKIRFNSPTGDYMFYDPTTKITLSASTFTMKNSFGSKQDSFGSNYYKNILAFEYSGLSHTNTYSAFTKNTEYIWPNKSGRIYVETDPLFATATTVSYKWNLETSNNLHLQLKTNTIIQIENTYEGCYGTLITTQGGAGGFSASTDDVSSNYFINAIGGNFPFPTITTPGTIDLYTFYYSNNKFYWNYGHNYTNN